jgi:uroporphyrinogen III methyltransferase/synthase
VVVIGQVARGARCGRGAAGPLAGRRVLVTRPAGRQDELHDQIAGAGGECLHVPAIRIAPPDSWEPLDAALAQIDSFDWIVFASVNGVHGFVGRLRAGGRDGRALGTARLAAIGPATRRELEAAGFRCDLTADVHSSEGMVEAFAATGRAPRRFLLVRANRGRDVMRRDLEARGHAVFEVPAYSSEAVAELDPATAAALDACAVDWITITSSFIAESAASLFGDRLARWRVASISPVTSATLRRLGIEPAVEAASADTAGLVDAMAAWEAAAERRG